MENYLDKCKYILESLLVEVRKFKVDLHKFQNKLNAINLGIYGHKCCDNGNFGDEHICQKQNPHHPQQGKSSLAGQKSIGAIK